MTWREQIIIAFAASLAACASAPRTDPAAGCTLARADSVYLSRGPVYRDCAVTRRAELVDRTAHPDFRPNVSSGRSCYSAEIQFVVDTTGAPEEENATIVRATDPVFAQAALAAVMRWRYKPAQLHDVPVRQIVREKEGVAALIVGCAGRPNAAASRPRSKVLALKRR